MHEMLISHGYWLQGFIDWYMVACLNPDIRSAVTTRIPHLMSQGWTIRLSSEVDEEVRVNGEPTFVCCTASLSRIASSRLGSAVSSAVLLSASFPAIRDDDVVPIGEVEEAIIQRDQEISNEPGHFRKNPILHFQWPAIDMQMATVQPIRNMLRIEAFREGGGSSPRRADHRLVSRLVPKIVPVLWTVPRLFPPPLHIEIRIKKKKPIPLRIPIFITKARQHYVA
nr:hypothetical protein Iba_chr12dCG4730 [Ipomoea batatas]